MKRTISRLAVAVGAAGLLLATVPAAAQAGPAPAANAGPFVCGSSRDFEVSGGAGVTAVPVAFGVYVHCLFALPTSGPHVVAVQRSLAFCHGRDLGPGGIDGVWDAATQQALESVQDELGVTRNNYGPSTRNAIQWPLWQNGFQGTCVPFSDVDLTS